MLHSYSETDALVQRYKNGEIGALPDLIEAFEAYIKKWCNVLSCSWINVQDAEVASFVSLFNYDSVHEMRTSFRRAFGYMNKRDFYSEVILLFIMRAARFEKGKVHFAGYLRSTFRYVIFRWVKSHMSEPDITYNSDAFEELISERPAPTPAADLDTFMDGLDLTPRERGVFYLKHVSNIPTEDIARIFGVTTGTVNTLLRSARKKIASV